MMLQLSVQVPEDTVHFSSHVNTLGKRINPSLLPPTMGK